jgi:phenylacetate-CoA ligase
MFEDVYLHCPILIQNLLVSGKGLLLRVTRTAGVYKSTRQALSSRSSWSAEEFEVHSILEFAQIINWAVKNVPYYRDNRNMYSLAVESRESISAIPVLRKSTIKRQHAQFVSEVGTTGYQEVQTTGTTGSPLQVTCDNRSRQINYAYFDSYLESIGADPLSRHVVIGGRVIVPPSQRVPPFWRRSVFQNALLMSSYHLNEDSFDCYLDKLERFSPSYVEAYPSSIYLIARHALKTARKVRVGAVITSAETLYPEQREAIESAFSCKVFDQYGCAEMAVFAAQCPRGSYHIRPDYGLVEIVDENGDLVPDGVVGNIVCTGFVNRMMPLIRYEIGDRAAIDHSKTCSCGLATPILTALEGRIDDVVICGNGAKVGRLSPVLKGFPIEEAQYVQRIAGELEVRVVPSPDFDGRRDIERIEKALRLRVGDETKVTIECVESLERGRSGKLRSVISLIPKE